MDMGFSGDAVEAVLASGLDYNAALDKLLTDASMATNKSSRVRGDGDSLASKLRNTGDLASTSRIPIVTRGGRLASSGEIRLECTMCRQTKSSACRCEYTIERQARDPKETGNVYNTDWQILLGLPETALPVATGIGLSSLRPLGAVSQAVGEASDAVFPIVKQMAQDLESRENIPPCQLARVLHSSTGETCDSNQLLVQRGTLILIFPATATSIGWIYAERLCGSNLAGWVPTHSVKVLPSGYQLRQVGKTCHSVSDSHLAAAEGDVILVSEETTTEGGWIYAEHYCDGSRTGWIPASAAECIRSGLEWVRCARSQVPRHETQMIIESNILLLVDRGTCTKEGWVYAWGRDGYSEDAVGKASLCGWVPMDCLEWHVD